MRQAILMISAMSMFAALCEQLLNESIYKHTIRTLLGLQIFLSMLSMLCVWVSRLN